MKLGNFLDLWLNNTVKITVRRSTFGIYKGYVEKHISPELGEFALRELNAECIQDFAGKLCQKLASSTARSVILLLKSAINYAVSFGHLEETPCNGIKMPKIKLNETIVFSQTEQRKLEFAVLNAQDKRRLGIMICIYTGLRLGELCALKWKDVDFENSSLKIKASLNRVSSEEYSNTKKTLMLEEGTKTQKSRRIVILPQFLSSLLQKERNASKSEYVISMKNGDYVQPRTMQNIYARVLQDANIPYRNFHALRHTFATRAIELGADVKTISETLGHSNSNITINRYVHSLLEQKRNMMQRMDSFFKNQ